ncbi:unnamed protein product [Caenorhabditis auriculariae]|uniref:Uncharacterized protein n=1 Tax=Caenorhabditis auriculariae TaxID=2777116 RepID=A0A8S1HCW8_9PELO|nr:unnamed protein product [Caenorhabditis auriculariae]
MAGGTAGVVAWIVVCPLEVVKNRIQVDKSTKKLSAMKLMSRIWRKEGFGAFFRDCLALSIRGFVVNATIFVVYEKTLELFS